MTGSYTGLKCLVCENKFIEGDDIVVCPTCGTPYHRSCYEKSGECVNHALHEQRESWSDETEQSREEQKYDGNAPFRCSKCGTVNPVEGIFCQICGCRLGGGEGPHSGSTASTEPISLNPFTTPYGGISPDEEIDGVSVRDIALFVGENSHYFIPKFKSMFSEKRTPGWNWASFLFRGFYFLYRKMYLMGVVLLLLTVLLQLPLALMNVNYISSEITLIGEQLSEYNRMVLFTNFSSLAISLFCAAWGNRSYCRRVLSSVKKLRRKFNNDVYSQEYILALTKKGRTNRALILVIIILILLSSMLFSALLLMFAA